MDIQICQSCGAILRGKSKFCTGCGTGISKFSPVVLSPMLQSAAPLSMKLDPDPLVVERTMNRVQYAQALVMRADSPLARKAALQDGNSNGNGHGNGNGNGHAPEAETSAAAPAENGSQTQSAPAPSGTIPATDQLLLGSGPASRLQSVLGQATAANAQARQPGGSLAPEDYYGPPAEAAAQGQSAAAQSPKVETPSSPSASESAIKPAVAPAPPAVAQTSMPSSPGEPAVSIASPSPAAFSPEGAEAEIAAALPQEAPEDLSAKLKAFHEGQLDSPSAPPPVPPAVAAGALFSQASSVSAAAKEAVPMPETPAKSEEPDAQTPPQAVSPTTDASSSSSSEKPANVVELPVAKPASDQAAKADEKTPTTPVAPKPAPAAASFDFFADTFPSVAAAGKAGQPASTGSDKDEPRRQAAAPAAKAEAAIDIPPGMPPIVAEALRAATANQTETTEKQTKDKPSEDKDEYPDESVKRRKKSDSLDKDSDDDDSKEAERDERRGYKNHGRRKEDPKASHANFDKVTIGSFKFEKKQALIAAAIIAFIGLPVCLLIMGTVTQLVGGAVAGVAGMGQVSLNGRWVFGVLDTGGHNHPYYCDIRQAGSQFIGRGLEDGDHSFRLGEGVIQDKHLKFTKMYVDPAGNPLPDGKAIHFEGVVDWTTTTGQPYYAHMDGQWMMQKRIGYGWRGKIAVLSNKWEAGLVQPSSEKVAFNPGQAASSSPGIFHLPSKPSEYPKFFMEIFGVLMLIGLVLVFSSMRLFGPAGMLNIWEKKKYIPSQYRSHHNKVLREFGQAPKPGGMPLGTRADWNPFKFWLPKRLAMPPDVREKNPHMLVIGTGHKGKTRLLAGMVAHDIECGDRAVAVIDSDGALVELISTWIASHPNGKTLAKRVIVIDPLQDKSPCFNPLEYPDDDDLQAAASALVGGFKAMYTEPPGSQSQWNQQTADILRNSAILLMANDRTLVDLPVLLSENDFRDVLLAKVEGKKDEKTEFTSLIEAWARYKRMARTDQWINWIEPILNRINPMLGDPRIRPILTKTKGDLNLQDILKNRQILLVRVPHGQHAKLLGSLIVSGLKFAASALQRKTSITHHCALYLDEFDDFIEKDTLEAITSKTNQLGLGLVCCAKTLQSLPEDYRNNLIINMGVLCVFSLSKKDADMIGPQMFRVDGRKIKQQTLQNIFNRVNTSPQFELITDEEKLNIDRVVGMEERTYFCYRIGTVAGVFYVKSFDFKDPPESQINRKLLERLHGVEGKNGSS